jgi:tetratricopeptide (TPR) repeat protein
MYEAGDAEGAMLLIREGLHLEQGTGLLTDLGNYAFAAARAAATDGGVDQQGGDVPPEVAELYRTAIDAYMRVFATEGTGMEVAPLRNVLAAYIQLGELDAAIGAAEEILGVRGDDAALWNTYATALQRADRVDDALAALAHVEELDPDFPDLYARQGSMLLNQGVVDEALSVLRKGVERGQSADQAARMILARAHQRGVQAEDWAYAIRLLEQARTFEVSEHQGQELDFWLGYSLLQHGRKLEEPKTLETARATLPMFQRAHVLLSGCAAYDARQGGRMNVPQLLDAVAQYIDIEQAVIRRGGGRP